MGKTKVVNYTPEQLKAAIVLKNGGYSPSWISFMLHDQGVCEVGPQMVGAVVNGRRNNPKVYSWIVTNFSEELAVVSGKMRAGSSRMQ